MDKVKLTVELEPELHRRVKLAAVAQGVSLAEVVRTLLERYAAAREARGRV